MFTHIKITRLKDINPEWAGQFNFMAIPLNKIVSFAIKLGEEVNVHLHRSFSLFGPCSLYILLLILYMYKNITSESKAKSPAVSNRSASLSREIFHCNQTSFILSIQKILMSYFLKVSC